MIRAYKEAALFERLQFRGDRLQLAREFAGWTQKKLADEVAASPSIISLFESGKKDPSTQLLSACAEALGVLPDFFYGEQVDHFLEEQCNFRHRRSAIERDKSQVRAHATLIGMIIEKLRTVLRFPSLNLPHFKVSSTSDIETIADETRAFWNIDRDAPIHQNCRVVENSGIFVVPHVVKTTEIDAFSREGSVTVIFLNQTTKSSSRWNFDIAHECGHLVMHQGIRTGSKESESEADRFASAFLMPGRAFAREFGRLSFSWRRIFDLKARWHTSVAAIVKRAYDLSLISAIEYRRAYKYLSAQGWNTGEPDEPPFLEPEMLRSALLALGTKVPMTVEDVCRELHLTHSTFAQITAPIMATGASGRSTLQLIR